MIEYLELLDHVKITWMFVAHHRIYSHQPHRHRLLESDVDNDMLKESVLGLPARPIMKLSLANFRGWWLS